MTYASPNGNANSIGSTTIADSEVVHYGFAAEAAMSGGLAPGRRTVLPAVNNSEYTLVGYRLFDAAVAWTSVELAVGEVYSVPINSDLLAPASMGVLANDHDLDGDTKAATVVDNPNHGSLTLNSNGSFTYPQHRLCWPRLLHLLLYWWG